MKICKKMVYSMLFLEYGCYSGENPTSTNFYRDKKQAIFSKNNEKYKKKKSRNLHGYTKKIIYLHNHLENT